MPLKPACSESPCQVCQMRGMFSMCRFSEVGIMSRKLNSNPVAFSELCPPPAVTRAPFCWFNYSKTQICQAGCNTGKCLSFCWECSSLLVLPKQLHVPVRSQMMFLSFLQDSRVPLHLSDIQLRLSIFPFLKSTTEISHLVF